MKRALVLAAALMTLTACATAADRKAAVCDGKHRRPANLHGSVLPTAASANASTPAPNKPGEPAPTPGPQSSIDPRSYTSCGAVA